MSRIVPVILCSATARPGAPISARGMDSQTLLQETARRAQNIVGPETDIVIVTLSSMKAETAEQLQKISARLTRHILGEPQPRNTAAAIAFATLYVKKTFGDSALIWVLPSDHHIGDEPALSGALSLGVKAALDGHMVTFGIRPTRPETRYRYIQKDRQLNGNGAYKVKKFIGKPAQEEAQHFVTSSEYLWSCGMHVFRATTGMENFQRPAPVTWNTVGRALRESMTENKPSSTIYGMTKEEPFETAVMEHADNVAVIPCDPQWSDAGYGDSAHEIMTEQESGNGRGNAVHGEVVCENVEGSIILAQNRHVTCIGLKNIVVIETAHSVLVADRQYSGSLRNLVGARHPDEQRGIMITPEAIHHWGNSKTLAETPRHKIYDITIKPGLMRDVETRARFPGYWIVMAGEALFMIDGHCRVLSEKESIFIPAQSAYKLVNPGAADLRLYHFQCNDGEIPEGYAPAAHLMAADLPQSLASFAG
ncbi:MAG: hypothetical protein HYU57_07490 [Micavibrio aeruginosavorus]|nr:hypothetical protein [Micavibrio aeruginosavorus]